MATHEHIEIDGAVDINTAAVDLFANTNLLSNLSIKYVRDIIKQADSVSVSAGQVIIRDTEVNNCYYMIQSGICEVIKKGPGDDHEQLVTTLERGDAFGEEALISDKASDYLIRMKTAGMLLLLSKYNFDNLIKIPTLKKLKLDDVPDALEAGSRLIDIRPNNECNGKRIKGSINIEKSRFYEHAHKLDENRNYIVCGDNPLESSVFAFKLIQKGIVASYLDEVFSRCLADIQKLPMKSTKKMAQDLEIELNNTKKLLQASLNKNNAIINERNQFRSRAIQLQKLLKKTFSTQKLLVEERRKTKLHLAGLRQAIRSDLMIMVDAMNKFIKSKRNTSVFSQITKEDQIKALKLMGNLVVANAKRINFRTQQITSSTKILNQLAQKKATTRAGKENKGIIGSQYTNSPGHGPTGQPEPANVTELPGNKPAVRDRPSYSTDNRPVEKSNVVDLSATNAGKKVKIDDAGSNKPVPQPDDDFMKRYEQTMWKTQDIQRLKNELEDTHTNIFITDIDKYLNEDD